MSEGRAMISLAISGMTCAACARRVEKALFKDGGRPRGQREPRG
jgi:hypothetical protein